MILKEENLQNYHIYYCIDPGLSYSIWHLWNAQENNPKRIDLQLKRLKKYNARVKDNSIRVYKYSEVNLINSISENRIITV